MNSPFGALARFTGDVGRGWDRFWFSPTDPTTLAFIRICCGLLTLYVHLTYSWGLLSYVGPHGWVDKESTDYIRREITIWGYGLTWEDQHYPYSTGNYFWSVFYHVTDPGWIIALHVFFLACMLAFAVGLWTPYTGFLTWVGAMSYVQRASCTVFGLDTMMLILLLYIQIGPSGATWSLDRWLQERWARAEGKEPPPVEPSVMANFAIRMIQFHFAFIYFASGTSKLLGATWWSGTALNLVVLNPSFAPMDWAPYLGFVRFLSRQRWMWEIAMTGSIVGTLLLEVSFIFLVWQTQWRWVMISAAVLLHTGIGLIMGLTTFSLMMMIMVASFLPPEVLQQVGPEAVRSLQWLFVGDKAETTPQPPRQLAGVR
jgi:hypothetical protein